MSTHGPWQGVSLLSYLMAAVGCFYVLYGVGMIVKRLANNSGRPLSGGFKFSKTATGSISLSMGRTRLAPMILTVACCLVLITVPATIALAKYFSRYPMYTMGCVERDQKNCTIDEMVKVVEDTDPKSKTGWMILGYKSKVYGYQEIRTKFCPDYRPPFDQGDYIVTMRYENRYECWSLRPDDAFVVLRKINNKTDSEAANERTR